MRSKHAVFTALSLSLAFCLGCGGTGEVTGVVKFKGKPLPAGTVTLTDARHQVWTGEIQPDGQYKIVDVPAGTVQAAFVFPVAISMPGAPLPKLPKLPDIPLKYMNPADSGITFNVRSGTQIKDFDLE